jgi:hypothetical protein
MRADPKRWALQSGRLTYNGRRDLDVSLFASCTRSLYQPSRTPRSDECFWSNAVRRGNRGTSRERHQVRHAAVAIDGVSARYASLRFERSRSSLANRIVD